MTKCTCSAHKSWNAIDLAIDAPKDSPWTNNRTASYAEAVSAMLDWIQAHLWDTILLGPQHTLNIVTCTCSVGSGTTEVRKEMLACCVLAVHFIDDFKGRSRRKHGDKHKDLADKSRHPGGCVKEDHGGNICVCKQRTRASQVLAQSR